MSITAQQLSDLQADAAIGTDESIFTDAEISRIWERVSGAATDTMRHEAALALIFRQLLSDANKLHDYKAGSTTEEMSQVRAHLRDSYNMYKPSLDAAQSRSTQMARSSLRARKHQDRTNPSPEPNSREHRDDSL